MNPTLTDNPSVNSENIIEDVEVHIVGPNILQNDLLKSYLENEMAVCCRYHGQLMQLSMTTGEFGTRRMIMIDCDARESIDPWSEFELNQFTLSNPAYIAFYNVHPEAKLEQVAMERGIRGIFYVEESYKVLPRAIHAILEGELWFKRKALSECVMNGKNHTVQADGSANLTEREREILLMIAKGAGNQKISDAMRISLHTVKAHIYNIYKKLNLKDRLQATLWVSRNL